MTTNDILVYLNILISNPNYKALTRPECLVLCNQAQRELAGMVRMADENHHLVTTSNTLSTKTSVETYALPSNFVYMRRVENSSSPYYPLEAIDYCDRRDYTGNKEAYYIISERSITGSSSTSALIGIRNCPSTSASNAITYYYVKNLPDMTSTALTNTPLIPDQAHGLIAEKAAKIYLTLNGKSTVLVDDLIARHEPQFLNTIKTRQKQTAQSTRVEYSDY